MNKKTLNNILIGVISTLIGVLLISIGFIAHMFIADDSSTITQSDIDKIHKSLNKDSLDAVEEFRNLPPLIKAYIRVGAWIGSGAILDKKFNTTDVLIVLDSKNIIKKYSQLSFNKN